MTIPYKPGGSTGLASLGFVVAMRATLLECTQRSRQEWIIVSRWGAEGEHLALAWTDQAATSGDAPMHLMPRHTALAIIGPPKPSCPGARFQLTSSLPDRISVAGAFVPADGHVSLYGWGPSLRVRSHGRFLSAAHPGAWSLDAVRSPWMGEFIES